MIISFLIGIVLRLVNILFSMMPFLGNIIGQLGSAIQFFVSQAMAWNFLFPIKESMQIIVMVIQFEFGIMIFVFVKWVVELVRGK
jgi:hypothetical protein